MTDINLLPEELREKELKEKITLNRFGKKPKLEYSRPLTAAKENKNEHNLIAREDFFIFKKIIAVIKSWLSKPNARKKPTIEKVPSYPAADLKRREPKAEGETAGSQDHFWQKIFHEDVKNESRPDSGIQPIWQESKGKAAVPALIPLKLKPEPAQVSAIKGSIALKIKEETQAKLGPKQLKQEKPKTIGYAPILAPEVKKTTLFLRLKQILSRFFRRQKGEPAAKANKQRKETAGVNLVPFEIFIAEKFREKIILFVLSVLACVIVVGLAYLSLEFYQPPTMIEVEALKSQINILDKRIAEIEGVQEEYQNLQLRISIANILLKDHVYWTNLFEFLEHYTLPTVSYLNFAGDISGNLNLSAITVDYYDVARQMLVFSEAAESIESLDISGISQDLLEETEEEDKKGSKPLAPQLPSTKYSLTLKVKPSVFKKTADSN